ncbi:MAG: hypothetical protein ACO3RU_13555, partial [Planctomycetota bacterium]
RTTRDGPSSGRHPRRVGALSRVPSSGTGPRGLADPRARGRAILEAGIGLLLAAVALFGCALLTQTLSAR